MKCCKSSIDTDNTTLKKLILEVNFKIITLSKISKFCNFSTLISYLTSLNYQFIFNIFTNKLTFLAILYNL